MSANSLATDGRAIKGTNMGNKMHLQQENPRKIVLRLHGMHRMARDFFNHARYMNRIAQLHIPELNKVEQEMEKMQINEAPPSLAIEYYF